MASGKAQDSVPALRAGQHQLVLAMQALKPHQRACKRQQRQNGALCLVRDQLLFNATGARSAHNAQVWRLALVGQQQQIAQPTHWPRSECLVGACAA